MSLHFIAIVAKRAKYVKEHSIKSPSHARISQPIVLGVFVFKTHNHSDRRLRKGRDKCRVAPSSP